MTWEKLYRIFKPSGEFGWMNSHAQVPTVLLKEEEGIVRVYFSTRAVPGQSTTAFLDLDINDLSVIVKIHEVPVLGFGRPGTFDEHGIMPSSVVANNGKVYLYYSGWQRSVGVPYNNFTGLAISEDGGSTFTRYSEAPILDRNRNELFSATSPAVLFEDGTWKMWYCSGVKWIEVANKQEHTYDIKYAYSADGMNWVQESIIAIPQDRETEAITKPTVVKMNGCYHMWFCFRSVIDFRDGPGSYRIGYARSEDGINWKRDDSKAGIGLSAEGWDSHMIAYPEVKKIRDDYYMFYNGNTFGTQGFGLAKLKQ